MSKVLSGSTAVLLLNFVLFAVASTGILFVDSERPVFTYEEAEYSALAHVIDPWFEDLVRTEFPDCEPDEVFSNVFDVIPGSFTTHADQWLVNARFWSYVCMFRNGHSILLIIQDEQRVLHGVNVGRIDSTFDFDGNGLHELVISNYYGPQMGYMEGFFSVARFNGDSFESVQSFLTVTDECAALPSGLRLRYRVTGYYQVEDHVGFPSINFEVEPFESCDGYSVDDVLQAKAYFEQAGEAPTVVFDAITMGNEAFFSAWPHRVLSVEGLTDEYGQTPLMYAAARDSYPIVDALISGGVDVNEISPTGWSPLMYAARFHAPPSVIEVLLAAGADRQLRNQDNHTARDLAVEFGSPFLDYF